MTVDHHRLVLVDRGQGHVHRWWPTCDCGCGWGGQYRRRKQEAVKQYRRMVDDLAARDRARLVRPVRPARLTPAADVPEVLRNPVRL